MRAAEQAAARGWKLAILSNAPVEVAEAIDGLGWLAAFDRRFYSCHLRTVKPEPEAYLQVLRSLGAAPDRVVFLDDREINVKAAAEVGIDARLYTDAGQIRRLGPP